jgi:hypothetical protein
MGNRATAQTRTTAEGCPLAVRRSFKPVAELRVVSNPNIGGVQAFAILE